MIVQFDEFNPAFQNRSTFPHKKASRRKFSRRDCGILFIFCKRQFQPKWAEKRHSRNYDYTFFRDYKIPKLHPLWERNFYGNTVSRMEQNLRVKMPPTTPMAQPAPNPHSSSTGR